MHLTDLASRQHGVVSRAHALAAGIPAHVVDYRVHTGRWEAIHRGVYRVAGTERSWRQDLWAAVLAAGPGAVVSHRAAAALWELEGIEEIVEVSVVHGQTGS